MTLGLLASIALMDMSTTYERTFNDDNRPAGASDGRSSRMTVIVPTYRRTYDLGRCLDALAKQTRPPDRVIVVCQDVDAETKAFLAARQESSEFAFDIVYVFVPGQVAALNAALEQVHEGIVCFTDDDAAPRPDWLARIEAHYRSAPDVGGVGGRDFVDGELNVKERKRVGVLEWFGRPIGNPHCGTGPARPVDVLKGSNMSYRVAALDGVAFDSRLRGAGAQRHNDLAISLAVRKRGWKIVYDPLVAVDHYPGHRVDGIDRSEQSLRVIRESAYNEALAILGYLPQPLRLFYLLWSILVGTRLLPGFVQFVLNGTRHPSIGKLFIETVRARLEAAQTLRGSGTP
jgi:cellulose synthase/poly-beta-1,6-N-acetylglucosamine synthase-like glycosyltransferase